jgi:CHAT domain-containing protein
MRLMLRRAVLIFTMLAIGLLSLAPPAPAQSFDKVGDEAPVGKNATGEDCRVRLVQIVKEPLDYQRFNIYCEGWTAPSGEITRFRVGKDFPPERVLTDSGWQKRWEKRLVDCGAVEPTQILGVASAGLRVCKREDGSWPVIVAAAAPGPGKRTYTFETFPTNMRVLERAAEVLEGKRTIADAASAREGGQSGVIRRAEALVGASGKLIGVQDIGAAEGIWLLIKRYQHAGEFARAEAYCRRYLEIYDRVFGPTSSASVEVLSELGLVLANQGRTDEANRAFDRAQAQMQGAVRWDLPLTLLGYRAYAAMADRRPEDAIALGQKALSLSEARRGDTYNLGFIWGTLGFAYRDAGKSEEALIAADNAIRIMEKPGINPEGRRFWVGQNYLTIGTVLRAQKKYAEAKMTMEKALDRQRQLYGDSPTSVLMLLNLGQNSRQAGDLPAALGYFREAAELQIKKGGGRLRVNRDLPGFYLEAISAAAQARPAERPALMAEAVTAAQLVRDRTTAESLQRMATRVVAGNPALASVTREIQDTERRKTLLRSTLALEQDRPAEERNPKREEALKEQIREAEAKDESLQQRLQAEFPKYARLSAPGALTADEVARLLRPSEALVAFIPTAQSVWVLFAKGGTVSLRRAPLNSRSLDERVRAIRASLEPVDGATRAFDVATSAQLYADLLGPLATQLAGVKHLIAIPYGPLLSLPLGLLVTRPAAAPVADDYRQVAWLARDMAISVLPSVASLRELRDKAGRSAAPKPFIGFGDPIFAGATGTTRGVAAAADFCREGQSADLEVLKDLPRLPETAGELADIARTLGAGRESVILGVDATETRVRSMALDEYRVVAFATHGLLPSEMRCQSEPSLVLTPPAMASPKDDGLLDASEVAQLRLDADWVLLSACNTARADGKLGGESLSTLAQGFFYAGARALVASHWAVASSPTVKLTTGMFGVYSREPAAGRAEALRRSQLTLASEKDTSHPFFWAPFVLVGDGGPAGP